MEKEAVNMENMLSLSRNENESFEDYKERRRQMNLLTKIYKRYGPSILHDLDTYVTFLNKHGRSKEMV